MDNLSKTQHLSSTQQSSKEPNAAEHIVKQSPEYLPATAIVVPATAIAVPTALPLHGSVGEVWNETKQDLKTALLCETTNYHPTKRLCVQLLLCVGYNIILNFAMALFCIIFFPTVFCLGIGTIPLCGIGVYILLFASDAFNLVAWVDFSVAKSVLSLSATGEASDSPPSSSPRPGAGSCSAPSVDTPMTVENWVPATQIEKTALPPIILHGPSLLRQRMTASFLKRLFFLTIVKMAVGTVVFSLSIVCLVFSPFMGLICLGQLPLALACRMAVFNATLSCNVYNATEGASSKGPGPDVEVSRKNPLVAPQGKVPARTDWGSELAV